MITRRLKEGQILKSLQIINKPEKKEKKEEIIKKRKPIIIITTTKNL
jgi:hypothetical protein